MRLRVSSLRSLFVLAGLALLAAPVSAVTIDWVTVGDPGNAADTATNCYAAGCGSVADVYRISKYEVTNAQYTVSLPRFRGHPRSHGSAVGVCHGTTEIEAEVQC